MTVMYFHYYPDQNAIGIFSDRSQQHGGTLQPGLGTHGLAFEDFKKAGAGKIKSSPSKDGSYMIMPASPAPTLA